MAEGIRDDTGRILKNTDPLFSELAKNCPSEQYTSFCNELGTRYNQAEHIRTDQHLGNLTKALKHVLNKWVTDGKDVTRHKLESALVKAETGGFVYLVGRHFDEHAVMIECSEHDGEEVGTSRSNQAEDLARPNTGPSTAMTGNTFQTSTMSMTTRHRRVLQQSATNLLDDLDTDDVLPHLLQDAAITADDKAKVDAKSTRKEKVSALLDILPMRGDKAFGAFLDSLKNTKGSKHLHDLVKHKEETYNEQEQDVYEDGKPTVRGESSRGSNQPSGSGNITQGGVNLTISASGHGTVQNNTITGQVNNVNLK